MTRKIKFANNATSNLAAGITNSATSISLTPGTGAKFPSLSAGQFFMGTLAKSDGSTEVVKVTARATDTLTVVRAAESVGGTSTAYAFSAGDKFEARLTAGGLGNELDRLDGAAIISPLNKSADYTVTEADQTSLVRVDSSGGSKTITLPQISTLTDDFDVLVAKVSSDTNNVAVARSGTDTINGATSYNLTTQWQSVWLVADRSTNTWTAVSTSVAAKLTDAAIHKANPASVAFTKTGAGTASIKAGTKIDVAGTIVQFSADTSITMPTLTAGTDYAIWVKDDATIQATTNFTTAPGAGNWRKIGGFHYAPGGNAAAQAGGDSTPAINAYSLWDLKFRPACVDPRGMTLVADSFWSDIYLCGVDHLTNGTSKYNVTIADGSSPPKIPTKFGGNGTNAYSTLTWWEGNEVLQSYGKRTPTYDEFAALAYGTTEASSVGTDQGSTVLNSAYTSKWGCIQSSGCMWVWGRNFGGGAAGAAWTANTGGRGSTYQMENAVFFGGDWSATSISGSRASTWYNSPTHSSASIGVRGVCDHLIIE